MKTFTKFCAQGDVYFMRTNMSIPEGAVEVKPEGEYLIVTHSETNHHHVMLAEKAKMYTLPDSILNCLLIVNDPVALEHLRDYDTHEPIMFDKGSYIVRRQREYTPEGWRKVQD